ncbi:MAG: glutathionylspermidine synthase family protein [Chloroflexi bacterium]|nr:glutathionylspermidine synthase family protein [Chloroflexota bacterium]
MSLAATGIGTDDARAAPYEVLDPLPPDVFRQVWLETVFEEFKWDPQIGDTSVLSDFALLLKAEAWRDLSRMAEALAAESLAAEAELLTRPDLRGALGLPGPVRRIWGGRDSIPIRTDRDVRVIRFDFHHTTEGWRISEANIDTPSGFIESGGFSRRMAERYPGAETAGDPAAALAEAAGRKLKPGALTALIYATAYVDDRQVMLTIARELRRRGLRDCLIGPNQLQWREDGSAEVVTKEAQGEVDYLVRFFPGEWLPNLPRRSGWGRYFDRCCVPASNPLSALLVQSKRFPLVWDRLSTPLPTWRALLPETIRPGDLRAALRTAPGDEAGWLFKPAFGRAGDGVVMKGVSPRKAWDQSRRRARWFPKDWVAQRRFHAVPIAIRGVDCYPTIGVYTVDGRAAGIYCRVAKHPLIDHTAADVAVLLPAGTRPPEDTTERRM